MISPWSSSCPSTLWSLIHSYDWLQCPVIRWLPFATFLASFPRMSVGKSTGKLQVAGLSFPNPFLLPQPLSTYTILATCISLSPAHLSHSFADPCCILTYLLWCISLAYSWAPSPTHTTHSLILISPSEPHCISPYLHAPFCFLLHLAPTSLGLAVSSWLSFSIWLWEASRKLSHLMDCGSQLTTTAGTAAVAFTKRFGHALWWHKA